MLISFAKLATRERSRVAACGPALTISDFGATNQFSLHRFASPFTTSALLPIRRSKPMTFLRHVPIRLSMSVCSASLRIRTSSSILSTSYSMLWMRGPNASVMSSMSAYEIQSEVTEM